MVCERGLYVSQLGETGEPAVCGELIGVPVPADASFLPGFPLHAHDCRM